MSEELVNDTDLVFALRCQATTGLDGKVHANIVAKQAADRIEALEAEVERLREALAPFARAQHIVASIDGDRIRCVLTYPPEATHTFTLASLDAARATLAKMETK